MIPLRLDEIIKASNGKVLTPYKPDLIIRSISTDSRTIKKGDLFVAIKGERFDGHNFIADVIKKNASSILISHVTKVVKQAIQKNKNTVFIRVPDCIKALGDIARLHRRKLSARVIAVGGSNGKTTTKDMIAHIISKHYQTVKSPKSFNNFIGLPLTILSANVNTEYLIAEVGTNKPGEIDYLTGILKPDIAIITNISETHLEGLKNIKGVIKEESSLFKHLTPDNTAVYDSSNNALKRLIKSAEYKKVAFGMDSDADVRAENVKITSESIKFTVSTKGGGCYKCVLPVLGSWNIKNALSAFTVCYTLGVNEAEICNAFSDFRPPEMRMEKRVAGGVTFINDAYNANPASVSLLIADISKMKTSQRKVFIFGEMGELGKYSREFHRNIADKVAKSNIDIFVAIGKESKWTIDRLSRIKPDKITSFYYRDISDAIPSLKKIIEKGDTVLLKGSRTNGLEKVIECYTN